MVLTGGTAQMEGAVELAEEIFHMPVRLARPNKAQGHGSLLDNPTYSTGVGLLSYAQQSNPSVAQNARPQHGLQGGQWLAKVKTWIAKNF